MFSDYNKSQGVKRNNSTSTQQQYLNSLIKQQRREKPNLTRKVLIRVLVLLVVLLVLNSWFSTPCTAIVRPGMGDLDNSTSLPVRKDVKAGGGVCYFNQLCYVTQLSRLNCEVINFHEFVVGIKAHLH